MVLGENYNLTCTVMGADKLSPMISYKWIQNGDIVETIDNILSFSHFRLSNTGIYSCTVNISSNYVKEIITMTSNTTTLQVQSRLNLSTTVI